MARCPDCNKFCSVEASDPDASLDVERVGTQARITGEITLALCCVECGSETMSASYDVDLLVDLDGDDEHTATEDCELQLEDEDASATEEQIGHGRRASTAYGVEFTARIVCSCGKLGHNGHGVEAHFESETRGSGEFDECY